MVFAVVAVVVVIGGGLSKAASFVFVPTAADAAALVPAPVVGPVPYAHSVPLLVISNKRDATMVTNYLLAAYGWDYPSEAQSSAVVLLGIAVCIV